jgi:hypothetical protein
VDVVQAGGAASDLTSDASHRKIKGLSTEAEQLRRGFDSVNTVSSEVER